MQEIQAGGAGSRAARSADLNAANSAVFRDNVSENEVARSNLAAILEPHGSAQVRSL